MGTIFGAVAFLLSLLVLGIVLIIKGVIAAVGKRKKKGKQ